MKHKKTQQLLTPVVLYTNLNQPKTNLNQRKPTETSRNQPKPTWTKFPIWISDPFPTNKKYCSLPSLPRSIRVAAYGGWTGLRGSEGLSHFLRLLFWWKGVETGKNLEPSSLLQGCIQDTVVFIGLHKKNCALQKGSIWTKHKHH